MRRRVLLTAVMLGGLAVAVPAEAAVRVDVNAELRLLELGQTPPRHIPGAAYRVAVFTYEDPHGTGLGNHAAALVERAILTANSVSSLGVLRYEGDLSPREPGDLAYFDKVERVVASQGVSLAVWGRIARSGDTLVMDTYAQVPPDTVESHFTWRLRLPEAMGGGPLVARLRPNRFAIQSLRLPRSASDGISAAAERLDEVRSAAADGAALAGRLPKGQVYTLLRRQDDWVFLQVRGGPGGWARLPSCPAECRRFLDAAGFAGDLLGYMARGEVPPERPGLTAFALAVRDQLLALDSLGDPQRVGDSMDLALRWSRRGTRPSPGSSGPASRLPPGGSAAANAEALARLSLMLMEGFDAAYEQTRPELDALRRAVQEGRVPRPAGVPDGARALQAEGPRDLSPLDVGLTYDRISVDKDAVRSIALELVDAALLDPRNPDVLANVAVLFRSAGDAERAARAEQLARQAAVTGRGTTSP